MRRLDLSIIALFLTSSGLPNLVVSTVGAAPIEDAKAASENRDGSGRLGAGTAISTSAPNSPEQTNGGSVPHVAKGSVPNVAGQSSSGSMEDRSEQHVAKVDIAVICNLIDLNAKAAGMPVDFFARLLWKESRFDVRAVSPVGAQGIAQFMPYTAEERGLADPFDHAEAIRHSAQYLADLRSELGSWGLAAAAYNSGINRVKRWHADGGFLPLETEEYVNAITFRPAKWFREKQHGRFGPVEDKGMLPKLTGG